MKGDKLNLAERLFKQAKRGEYKVVKSFAEREEIEIAPKGGFKRFKPGNIKISVELEKVNK